MSSFFRKIGKVVELGNPFKQKNWQRIKSIGAPIASVVGSYYGGPAAGQMAGQLVSGRTDNSANDAYNRDLANQENFAQNGLSWRLADAKRNGIHPLAALGFQSPSFTPMGQYQNDSPSSSWSDVGQDIRRAVQATQTEKERQALNSTSSMLDALSLRNMELQNKNLEIRNAVELSRFVRNREFGPSFPVTNSTSPGTGSKLLPVTTTFRAPDGTLVTTMSETFNESTEGDPIGRTSGLYNTYYKPWKDQMTNAAEHWKSGLKDYYSKRSYNSQLQPIRSKGVKKRIYSNNPTPFF